jgi:uncharacterized protein RhaS with RHS repeats
MTGLVYARARWYDPGTGSFLSPDPLGYRDSSNLYAFAGGDPVNRRDPTGESYWVNRSNEIISILWKKRLPGWDNERSQLLAELRDLQEHKYETDPNAPENPGLFAKAVGAGKRWLGLGDELEERYKEKLRTGYPSHDRSDVPPEIAEVYGTEDRGAKLQRDTFEDIGGKGVNYGTQAAQGGVESAAIAGAGFATRGLLKSTQHVDIFLKANPRFRKWVGTGQMHVHHRIPQVYFRDGVFTHDMNSLTNLYALPKGVHEQMVTPAWNKFRKQNPHATRAEVMKFAIQIDQKIARYINTIGR